MLNELISSKKSADALRILSVGCGSGILDNQDISPHTIYWIFEYTGVDPNPVACCRFLEDFRRLDLTGVKLDVKNKTVESLDVNECFDVIQLTHSLYYFEDPADTLDKLRKLLAWWQVDNCMLPMKALISFQSVSGRIM